MESKKYYTIYRTTNNINGKIYVGQHVTYDLDDNYLGKGVGFRVSLKKHGRKNFTKETLHVYDNFKEMNDKEIEIVDEEFVAREDTYNLITGGRGYSGCDIFAEKNPMYGKKRPEHSKFMSSDDNPNKVYTKKYLDELYDCNKTITENLTSDGVFNDSGYKPLIKYVCDNNLDHVPGQMCIENYKRKVRGLPPTETYPQDYLDSIYDENRTIKDLATIDGKHNSRLKKKIVKYVFENNLPYVPGQKCIENYKKKHGITPVLHQFV